MMRILHVGTLVYGVVLNIMAARHPKWLISNGKIMAPWWSSIGMLDHRSLPPVFDSRRGHI